MAGMETSTGQGFGSLGSRLHRRIRPRAFRAVPRLGPTRLAGRSTTPSRPSPTARWHWNTAALGRGRWPGGEGGRGPAPALNRRAGGRPQATRQARGPRAHAVNQPALACRPLDPQGLGQGRRAGPGDLDQPDALAVGLPCVPAKEAPGLKAEGLQDGPAAEPGLARQPLDPEPAGARAEASEPQVDGLLGGGQVRQPVLQQPAHGEQGRPGLRLPRSGHGTGIVPEMRSEIGGVGRGPLTPTCCSAGYTPWRIQRTENGLRSRAPASRTSSTLRVTSTRPCTRAVAASRPSTTGNVQRAFMRPHSSAISAVTGRIRSAKSRRSLSSHRSYSAARTGSMGRSRSTPCRISPTVRTLSAPCPGGPGAVRLLCACPPENDRTCVQIYVRQNG